MARFKVHTPRQNFYCLQFLQNIIWTPVYCGGVMGRVSEVWWCWGVRVVDVTYCAQLELNLVTGRMCVHCGQYYHTDRISNSSF